MNRVSKLVKGGVALCVILVCAIILMGQTTYVRQRSVIASGGPNNLSSSSFVLEANVISQTAVSICATSDFTLYQGFLVPEGGKVSFIAECANTESHYPWSSSNKVILHFKFNGIWQDTAITDETGVIVPVDEVPSGEVNYIFEQITTGSNDTLRYALAPEDTAGRATTGATIVVSYFMQYKAQITITYSPAPPDTFGAGRVQLLHWLSFGNDLGGMYSFCDSTSPEFVDWVDYDPDVMLEFDSGTSGGTVSWTTLDTRSWSDWTHPIIAELKYEKPTNITFRAYRANGGTRDYSVWNANNKVAVHYLQGGTWHVGYITSSAGITATVDDRPSGYNYWYESVSILSPADPYHRFANTSADTAGLANGVATVELGYYEQYDAQVLIEFAPPPTEPSHEETLGAGAAQLLYWTYMDVDSAHEATYYFTHNTTFHKWVDAGSTLEFSPQTTPGRWTTINVRRWTGIASAIDAAIKYEKPIIPPVLTLYWRRYYLIGLPVWPTEVGDDPAGGHDPDHGYIEGDQDVILHDDFGGWGYFENRWRVSRYYPHRGSYKYYRGPGSIDRFMPGLGFWIVQNWRDRVDVTAYGGLVDTTSRFPISLARYSGESYSQYNMCANPFMNVTSGDIVVNWEDTHVEYTTASGSGEVDNPYAARLAGLIEQYIYVYRDGAYLALEYDYQNPHPLREWEGFWAKTLLTNASDTVTLKMIPHSGAGARRAVAQNSDYHEWYVELNLECDGSIIFDKYNRAGYRPYATVGYDFIGDVEEPVEIMYPEPEYASIYYITDGKKLMYDFRDKNFTWDVIVNNRFSGAKRMVLTWSLVRLPAGMRAYLFDKSANRLIDLQTESEYAFITSPGERYMTLLVKEESAGLPMPGVELPREMELVAYPNPFNTTLNIRYSVPVESDVEIGIYNMMGEKIRTLVNTRIEPGSYVLVWDGKDANGRPVGTSLYFIRFRMGNEVKTYRSVLIK